MYYILCVCVDLAIQHAKRMRCSVLSSVASLAPPYLSALSHKRHDFLKKKFLPSKQLYSQGWALASSTICLQDSRFLALSPHLLTPIFLRFLKKVTKHKMCFDFLYNFCLKKFLILRKIQQDIIINVQKTSRKVPLILI
jgi:hypothetical protein